MIKRNLSYWFIIVLFCAVGFLSWRVYFKIYRKSDTVSIHRFPINVGSWTAEEIPVSDDDKAILETDNVFVRRYTNSKGGEVFLFVVYSQNNRKVSHPPEICYTGAGATILDNVHDSFSSKSSDKDIRVNRLTIEKGKMEQIFVYWFKVGDQFTSNYWKQQGIIALNSIRGKPASSALIRVSSVINNGNKEEAISLIKSFSQQIVPLLDSYLP